MMAADSSLLSQVERAVFQLYSDPIQSDIRTAEKWLVMIQQSHEAWRLSWQLLEHERVEVQNFGAIMLKNKLAKSWAELSEDQYEPLRYELFTTILKFSGKSKLVLTQLCVAMVMYMFHTIPNIWSNSIVSILQTLQSSSSNASSMFALLELLKVIPEEFDETNNNIFAGKRAVIREEIKKGQSSVFSFIEQLLSSNYDTNIKLAGLQCLTSWGRFIPPLPEINSLINLLFHLIRNTDYLSLVVEVLTNIVIEDDSYKYPIALRDILLQLINIGDFVQLQLHDNDRDMDICSNLCALLTETLNSNMELLLEISEESAGNSEESVESLQLLLGFTTLTGHFPVDEKCSEITFNFWERFLDRLQCEEKCCFLVEFYEGILTSLIEIFPIKAQFPSDDDWTNIWDDDERDEFLKYRDELCDLGVSIQCILQLEYNKHLTFTLTKLFSQPTNPSWQSVEAILFLLQGTASNINNQTALLFQEVLTLYPRMPPHNTLAKSALRLLGCLAEWFKGRPDILTAVLPMILDNLSQPLLSASAALAFRDICGECNVLLGPIASNIVLSCQRALSNPKVSFEQCAVMIAAVGSVLSTLPLSSLFQPLELLLVSRIESLQTLAEQQPSINSYNLVKKELTILNSFCIHIYPTLQEGEQHPVIAVLVRLWPSLQSLLSKWMGDVEVVSIISSCLTRSLRTTGCQYLPLLPNTIQLILQCFSAAHYSKLLDTAAELVKQFGRDERCQELMLTFLQQLLTQCFQLCQHGLETMDPDTVQAMLDLLKQMLDYCPVLLFNMDGMLDSCFNLSLKSLQLPEQPSMSAASSLMVTIINLIPSSEIVRKLILMRGVELVEFLLKGVAGGVDRSRLDFLVNIFHALLFQCITELSNWLQELLSKEGFPTSQATPLEKQLFRQSLLRGRGQREVIKEKVKEFSLICRGFHGTLYAAETSQSLP